MPSFELEQTKFVNAHPCIDTPPSPHTGFSTAACPIKCKFYFFLEIVANGNCNTQKKTTFKRCKCREIQKERERRSERERGRGRARRLRPSASSRSSSTDWPPTWTLALQTSHFAEAVVEIYVHFDESANIVWAWSDAPGMPPKRLFFS